jgi:hypothetical protein
MPATVPANRLSERLASLACQALYALLQVPLVKRPADTGCRTDFPGKPKAGTAQQIQFLNKKPEHIGVGGCCNFCGFLQGGVTHSGAIQKHQNTP